MILGNHRDAWVYGAVDPNSGTASLLEVARGLAALVQAGWKPLRTIVLCSWDGEEYGLVRAAWGHAHSRVVGDLALRSQRLTLASIRIRHSSDPRRLARCTPRR